MIRVVIGLLAAMPLVFLLGMWKGSSNCKAEQKVVQLETVVEAKKAHADIDRKIPYSADRDARFKWLLENARP